MPHEEWGMGGAKYGALVKWGLLALGMFVGLLGVSMITANRGAAIVLLCLGVFATLAGWLSGRHR